MLGVDKLSWTRPSWRRWQDMPWTQRFAERRVGGGGGEGEGGSRAVVVTSAMMEPCAREWARRNSVETIEGPRLVELLLEYCRPGRAQDTATCNDRVGQ